MKQSLIRSAFLALAFAGASTAFAQTYPEKLVRLVVPFGPGSATDIVARLVTEGLTAEMGGTFIVENRPGALGTIAADMVAKAPADGHTLLLGTNSTNAAAPSLFKKLNYDPVRDFTAVGRLTMGGSLLLVRADLPVKTVGSLISWLKANPAQASYGYGNTGGQIAAGGFVKRAGIEAIGVAYKSTPEVINDLIGGRIAFAFIDSGASRATIQAGRTRALAIAGETRSLFQPDVPMMSEGGMPGFVEVSWIGIFTPAGTPTSIVHKLDVAIKKTFEKKEAQDRLAGMWMTFSPFVTPAAFSEFVKEDARNWATKIKAAGIEPQ